MDIEIFTLLKEQAMEVFTFLLILRDFASGKGLQNDVEKFNAVIIENNYIISIADKQLSDLKNIDLDNRMGLFDEITVF